MAWQDSHIYNIILHERLVNGWEKVWCVTLYLIRALGNSMEARFRRWLKNKNDYCVFLSQNYIFFLIIVWYKLAIPSRETDMFSELRVYLTIIRLVFNSQLRDKVDINSQVWLFFSELLVYISQL